MANETNPARFQTKDGAEFTIWLDDEKESMSERRYAHKGTIFPVLPAVGDWIEWSADHYRVVSRVFNGQGGGSWSATIHVVRDNLPSEASVRPRS